MFCNLSVHRFTSLFSCKWWNYIKDDFRIVIISSSSSSTTLFSGLTEFVAINKPKFPHADVAQIPAQNCVLVFLPFPSPSLPLCSPCSLSSPTPVPFLFVPFPHLPVCVCAPLPLCVPASSGQDTYQSVIINNWSMCKVFTSRWWPQPCRALNRSVAIELHKQLYPLLPDTSHCQLLCLTTTPKPSHMLLCLTTTQALTHACRSSS